MSIGKIPANIYLWQYENSELPTSRRITELDIFETGSDNFHEDGLFSTRIFGRVGTPERDRYFGYIDVKIPIMHPFIFKKLGELKGLYKQIMLGKAFAVFNTETKDFESSDRVNGKTGYYFFLEHWEELVFPTTTSSKRDDKISLIQKYKDKAFTTKILVSPAGLRDVSVDETGRPTKDEVNDLYMKLLSLSNGINASAKDLLQYDTTRASLQLAFNEIYNYYYTLVEGKKGFAQSKWGSRNVQQSSRNVITSMKVSRSSVEDPTAPNLNNTVAGLFQSVKSATPLAIRLLKEGWLNEVFLNDLGEAYLVDKSTLKRVIRTVSSKTYDKWNTSSGLESLFNSMLYISNRNKVIDIEGHYLGLIYRDSKVFKIFEDIDSLPEGFSKDNVYPLTLVELVYLSVYERFSEMPILTTRYPVTGVGSIYPSILKLRTTLESSVLTPLNDSWEVDTERKVADVYPDVNSIQYFDTMSPHPSRLKGLGAD